MFNGSLGGLGGRESSFPQRFGAPVSNQVQSLEEMQKPIWDEYNAAVAARQNAANDFWEQNQSVLDARTAGVPGMTPELQRQLDSTLKSAGSRLGGEWLFAHSPDSGVAEEYNALQAPIDVQSYQDRADAIAQPFLENQTRNQQAYDSMRNNGQINALIGPDYSNANFGSISGQGAAQLPEIDGVNMDWASGVYNPSKANGMFGNTGRTYKQGWL